MEAIILQILNGLDKGSAYALIALGLTLIFGTLGVVNFAHGALFMMGAFVAVTLRRILSLSFETIDETRTDFLGNPMTVDTPYVEAWFGASTGGAIIDWAVPLAVIVAIPVMALIGIIMERGLIRHFYKRPHADQILVTFGLAIVLQEIIKAFYGANPIPTPSPEVFIGSFDFGVWLGYDPFSIMYPYWRLVFFEPPKKEELREKEPEILVCMIGYSFLRKSIDSTYPYKIDMAVICIIYRQSGGRT